ncbi:glycosyltransferase [Desulfovibrio inopinatus]|uniref:glycosyltransferase n=1 Tax=Desulfovibrio inopinatus TaxID=102109 RepID=UPI000558D405|nr:glycosyltransferase [Desulfovibrio inopinatus]
MSRYANISNAQIIQEELNALSLDDACNYFKDYLHVFQIDLPLAVSCINRLLEKNSHALPTDARVLLEEMIKSAAQLANFDPDILQLADKFGLLPGADIVTKVLEATHVEPELFGQLRQTSMKYQGETIRSACRSVLCQHPMAIRYADLLLGLDLLEGRSPDESLQTLNCPKVLRPLWTKRLFDHFSTMGNDDAAWPLWKDIEAHVSDPFSFSRIAEMYRRAGQWDEAISYYEKALALAPLQYPYKLRLESLQSPFTPDPSLLERLKVCIYLYSWNKADVLGETLESLAACQIGSARISVLLNGCTDHSRQVVEQARNQFPHNTFEIIELPVNIGAPAARNWLLSQPSTHESDYVAFLDDDIYLQPDWLAHMLTVAESDPTIGNVGCKVVFPGKYKLLQYLYRHVAIANEETIRISKPIPAMQYDIGLYDVIRETRAVMGCQHLLRVASLKDAPWYDIRYSPTQIDDTDHDLQLCLAGWKVMYCGTVTCEHRQNSGTSMRRQIGLASQGNIVGNDTKFTFKWLEHYESLRNLGAQS